MTKSRLTPPPELVYRLLTNQLANPIDNETFAEAIKQANTYRNQSDNSSLLQQTVEKAKSAGKLNIAMQIIPPKEAQEIYKFCRNSASTSFHLQRQMVLA